MSTNNGNGNGSKNGTLDSSRPGRMRLMIQPAIVKLYRLVGIVALGVMLLGLLGFITVSVFYYFNHSWVRPVILSPTHAKVIEASTALNDARLRASELDSQRAEAVAALAQIDRIIPSNLKFEAEAAPLVAGGLKSADAAMVQRELDRSTLERAEATDRKGTLAARIKQLDGRVAEQAELVKRLTDSPYIAAAENKRVVGFVPYQNLSNVQPGATLYGCSWGLVRCHKVGKVLSLLDGEVQDVHPHDDSVQRGVMLEVQLFDPQAAEENVLFAGSKPFWLF
jgi:hypothetical protein